eukprot:COSAG01_NODE_1356_length_10592_cov_4.971995_2_plen_76_part_00
MLVLGFFVYMLVIFVPILKERKNNPKDVADDMLTETIEATEPPTEPSEPPMMLDGAGETLMSVLAWLTEIHLPFH